MHGDGVFGLVAAVTKFSTGCGRGYVIGGIDRRPIAAMTLRQARGAAGALFHAGRCRTPTAANGAQARLVGKIVDTIAPRRQLLEFQMFYRLLGANMFRRVARMIPEVDTLDGFLRDMRARYPESAAMSPDAPPAVPHVRRQRHPRCRPARTLHWPSLTRRKPRGAKTSAAEPGPAARPTAVR
jgi:hypothetical protein